MKRMVSLLFLAGLLGVCGCAHQYVMKLTNGVKITTASKPRLQGSYYHFKDARGQDNVIPQSRVTEIAPASVAAEENHFKVQNPRKKKWYWPF